jgi:hypothetical protein
VHGIFILFRQTLVTAVAFAFAVTAGQIRAENSFSTVVIDPGHGGSDPGGIPGQIVPEKAARKAAKASCSFMEKRPGATGRWQARMDYKPVFRNSVTPSSS